MTAEGAHEKEPFPSRHVQEKTGKDRNTVFRYENKENGILRPDGQTEREAPAQQREMST
jgi:hypothetical protein